MNIEITIGTVESGAITVFPEVSEPKMGLSGNLEYSATVLLDKVEDKAEIARLQTEINRVRDDYKQKNGGVLPPAFRNALTDADATDKPAKYPEYKGKMYISAKVKAEDPTKQPVVVDRMRKVISCFGFEHVPPADKSADRVWSGNAVQLHVRLYAYNKAANSGVGAALVAVRKLGDGIDVGAATPATPARANQVFTEVAPLPGSEPVTGAEWGAYNEPETQDPQANSWV